MSWPSCSHWDLIWLKHRMTDGLWNMDTLQDCSPCREEREAAGKCAEQKNKRQVCRVRHIQVTDTNSEDLWWTHEERQDRSTSASQCCLILTAVKSEVWTQCLFSQKVSNFWWSSGNDWGWHASIYMNLCSAVQSIISCFWHLIIRFYSTNMKCEDRWAAVFPSGFRRRQVCRWCWSSVFCR